MEPVQPPGVPGQSPEAAHPPQSVELPGIPKRAWTTTSLTEFSKSLKVSKVPEHSDSQAPEVNKSPVDPIDGMFKSYESGNKEEFVGYMETWSKQNPGMPIELIAASLAMSGGGNPEKTAQLLQWTQEAKRLGALGGKEGVQVYDQLREACRAGNQEAYNTIRRSGSPIAKKAVEMLGKDMLLGGETQPFLNLTKWDSPHKTRELLESLQQPPPQET